MAEILGIVTKKQKIGIEALKPVFKLLEGQGTDGWRIYLDGELRKGSDYSELYGLDFQANEILFQTSQNSPIVMADEPVLFSGHIYNNMPANASGFQEQVEKIDGDFSIAYSTEKKLFLARDPIGIQPLYSALDSTRFAFCSQRNALERIGLKNIHSLKPGTILEYTDKKQETIDIGFFEGIRERRVELSELNAILLNAVRKRVEGLQSYGVMFSGGVDSAFLALAAKKFNPNIKLFSMGTADSEDLRFCERFVDKFSFDWKKKVLSDKELAELYEKLEPEVASSSSPSGLMKVELSIPVFVCCETARESGVRALLCGQGAEELFAGYHAHYKFLKQGGDLDRRLLEEVRGLHSKDLERSSHIASLTGVDVRYPFLDLELIKTALCMPVSEKISLQGETKIPLRKIAQELGVPDEFALRPKRAAQYGSGIHKALTRIRRTKSNSLNTWPDNHF